MSVTWFDSVTITLEAALSATIGDSGVWDSGLWDTATWGPDIVWADISPYLRSISTSRRFSRDVLAWEAGLGTFELDNTDGRFSPNNLSGPYVSGGITQVRPWRPIRLSVAYAGVTYWVFTGYATAWQESYDQSGNLAIVTVPCVDELARLAKFDGYEQASVGAGEMAGPRIHRVLNNAGHVGVRDIDGGTNTMQATTLAQNTVTELKLTADSDAGAFYIEGDGSVVYEGQHALIENSRSNTVQATFGDGAGELPYHDVTLDYSGDLTANIVAYARVGGTAQVAVDNASRALYNDLRLTRSDLICETDAQTLDLASLDLLKYKNPESRIVGLKVRPRKDPATLFPQVLGRRVRDKIRVIRRPPGGFTASRDVFIAGVGHDIAADGTWVTNFDLWSASPFADFGMWDSAVWDTTKWFF